jgi:hypothetical protein
MNLNHISLASNNNNFISVSYIGNGSYTINEDTQNIFNSKKSNSQLYRVYKVADNIYELGNKQLLKVNNTTFQEVTEVIVDLSNEREVTNVINRYDFAEEAKKELLSRSQDTIMNNKSAIVKIYTSSKDKFSRSMEEGSEYVGYKGEIYRQDEFKYYDFPSPMKDVVSGKKTKAFLGSIVDIALKVTTSKSYLLDVDKEPRSEIGYPSKGAIYSQNYLNAEKVSYDNRFVTFIPVEEFTFYTLRTKDGTKIDIAFQ